MYATQDDITALYGPDALFVADRDGDGVAEAASVTRALEEASAEIDSFLAPRFDLPLAESQPVLRRLAVDIALYRLTKASDVATEELRKRYDDAMKTLERIQEGKQSLILPPGDIDGDGEDDGAQPVVQSGPARLFSRERTRGL